MIDQEKVLQAIKERGYVLPVHLSSRFNTNTITMGAVLSDLSAQKKLKISVTKVGGSPVYYLEEQKEKLQDLFRYLNEKDKRTYTLLKEKKVLRDDALDALTRVSLRIIKDFAYPLEVTLGQTTELFWKWYLLSEEETIQCIKEILTPTESQAEEQVKQNEEAKQAIPLLETVASQSQVQESKQESKEPTEESHVLVVEKRSHEKKETRKKEQKKKEEVPETRDPSKQTQLLQSQVHSSDTEDLFGLKIEKYFNENNIKILSSKVIRRNAELEYELQVPSPVGFLDFFCRAKQKKSISDGDIASLLITAQVKKLPVLFVVTGDLTKKAKAMLAEAKTLKIITISER